MARTPLALNCSGSTLNSDWPALRAPPFQTSNIFQNNHSTDTADAEKNQNSELSGQPAFRTHGCTSEPPVPHRSLSCPFRSDGSVSPEIWRCKNNLKKQAMSLKKREREREPLIYVTRSVSLSPRQNILIPRHLLVIASISEDFDKIVWLRSRRLELLARAERNEMLLFQPSCDTAQLRGLINAA